MTVLVATVAAAACGDAVSSVPPPPAPPPSPPAPTSLRIEVTGWGNARDGDGFEVTVGGLRQSIAWNGVVRVDSLPPLTSVVALEGISYHCRADSASKSVTLAAGRVDTVRFAVGCFGDMIYHESLDAHNTRIHYRDTLGADRVLAPATGNQWAIEWHPDGDHLLVNSNQNGMVFPTDAASYDIGITTRSGSPIVWVGQSPFAEVWPSWSPDANRIVYNRNHYDGSGIYEIRVVNSDGTNDHQLVTPSAADFDPAWVLGGTAVVFGCTRFALKSGICRTPSDGGPVTSVATDVPFAQHFKANPAGDWVTFLGQDSVEAIYLTRASGGVPQRLDPLQVTIGADWSPDGVRIALSTIEGTNPYRYGIRIYDRITGTISSDLAAFSGTQVGMSWSPDGKWIAMAANGSPGLQIFVFRADGAGRQQITFGSQPAFRPIWRNRSTFVDPPSWLRLDIPAGSLATAALPPIAVERGQCFGFDATQLKPTLPVAGLRRRRSC